MRGDYSSLHIRRNKKVRQGDERLYSMKTILIILATSAELTPEIMSLAQMLASQVF